MFSYSNKPKFFVNVKKKNNCNSSANCFSFTETAVFQTKGVCKYNYLGGFNCNVRKQPSYLLPKYIIQKMQGFRI